MTHIALEAEIRTDLGKGASRRLRRLHNQVPAVLFGGNKKTLTINLSHNKVIKALETESIYSSVLDLHLDGKVENVILKDLQRHPYKAVILHMDFQRVSDKDILVKMVPLHFTNEEKAPGVKDGGIVNHTMSQVEIRCQVKDLPEFIEVDLQNMALNDVVHLSQLVLPKNVKLATDPTVGDHDHPVVSIHIKKADISDLEAEAAEAAVAEASAAESAAAHAEDAHSSEDAHEAAPAQDGADDAEQA